MGIGCKKKKRYEYVVLVLGLLYFVILVNIQKKPLNYNLKNSPFLIKTTKKTIAKSSVLAIHISGGTNKLPNCSVDCYWPRNQRAQIISHWHIDELGINVVLSMESEVYYSELSLSSRNKNKWLGTTRLDSDIPMPYFSWAEYNIQKGAPDFDKVTKAAVFIARNCNSKSGRESYIKELIKYMPVHSVSTCLNNKILPPSVLKHKEPLMRRYALYLAFENSIVDDYVTEKFWGALSAGIIPVYFGAPNIHTMIPGKLSFVSVRDYKSPYHLALHLKKILTNKTLYNEYHKWRNSPLLPSFVKKFSFTHVHSKCRVCEKAISILINT